MTASVLIVGAGPVGLTAALELARYSVPVRIIDKTPSRSTKSKALVIWPRTLELLHRAGVVDDLISVGIKAEGASVLSGDRSVFELKFTSIASPYPYALLITQDQTERVLEEHLQRLGIQVERSVEMTSVAQTPDEVNANLQLSDGTSAIAQAQWLIGCDGAHSTVRHALNKTFDGTTNPFDFLLADVHLTSDRLLSRSTISMYAHRDGMLALFPIGHDRFRVIADLGEATTAHRADPSLADVQTILDDRGPCAMTAHDPIWISLFRINERQAGDYRDGRMFLAGDAAHVHSPAGGQGMNTGMQDACNLAWKIALVARGEGNEQTLLPSYNAERHPVAKGVIEQTQRLTTAMTLRNPIAQQVRNVVLHAVFGIPAVEHAVETMMSEITIGYPDSTLSKESGLGAHVPRAGRRAPIRDSEPLVGAGPAPRFVLYAEEGDRAKAFVAEHGAFVDARIRQPFAPGGLWLVRPDGYVGLASGANDWEAANDYVRELSGGQSAAAIKN